VRIRKVAVFRGKKPDAIDYLAFYAMDFAEAMVKDASNEIKSNRKLSFWENLLASGVRALCQYNKNSLNDELCFPIKSVFTKSPAPDILISPKKIVVSKPERLDSISTNRV
jgi:hypothetical protein